MEYLTIKAFLTWVRKVPSWVWILLFLVASHATLYGMYRYESNKADKAKAELSAYKTEIKKAVTEQLAQNAAKEAQDRAVFAAIAEQYKKDIADAKAKSDDVIAGLRAGTIKLRKQWQGCSVPAKAADGSSGVDEDSRLREESAARIIGNAAEADSWILRLQEVIRQLQAYPANADPEGLRDK